MLLFVVPLPGMQFWAYPVVFISDLEVLKDTLLHQADNFSDRPTDNPFINMVFNKKGKQRIMFSV